MSGQMFYIGWGTALRYVWQMYKEYIQGAPVEADTDVIALALIQECAINGPPRDACHRTVMAQIQRHNDRVLAHTAEKMNIHLLRTLPEHHQRQAMLGDIDNPHLYALETMPEYKRFAESVAQSVGVAAEELKFSIANTANRTLQITAQYLDNVTEFANQTASDLAANYGGIGGRVFQIPQDLAERVVEFTKNSIRYTACNLNNTDPMCAGISILPTPKKFDGVFQNLNLGWYFSMVCTLVGVAISGYMIFKCCRRSSPTVINNYYGIAGQVLKHPASEESQDHAEEVKQVRRAARNPTKQILQVNSDQLEEETKTPRRAQAGPMSQSTPPQSKASILRQLDASNVAPSKPNVGVQRVAESKARVQRVAAKYRNTIDELVGTSFEKALENLVGWIAANLPPEGQKLTWSQTVRWWVPLVCKGDIKEKRQSVRGPLLVALLCADASELPSYHPCSRQFEPETQKEWDKLGRWEVEFYGEICKLKNRDIQAQTKVAFLLHVLQNPTRWRNPKHWFGNGNIPRYEKSELLGYIYSHSSEYEQLLPQIIEILAARPLLLQTYLEDIIDAANESDFAFHLEKDIKAHTKAAGTATETGTATEIKESKWIYGPVWKSPEIDWAFVYYSLKTYSPTNQEKVTADMLRANTRLSKDQLYWLSHNDIVWITHLLEHRLQEGIQSRHQVFLPFDTSSTIFKPGVVHDQLWNLMVSGKTGLGGDTSLGHLKVTLLQAAARLENEILEEHFLFTTGVFNRQMAPIVKASLDAGERAIPEIFQCRDFLMTPTVQQVQWLDSADFRADSATIMADRLVKETKTYAAYFTKVHGKEVDQKGDICKVHVLTTIETSVSFVKTPLFDECRQVHFQLRQEFPGWNVHLDRFNYYQPIQNGKYTMVVHQRKSVPALSKTVTTQMLTPAVLVKLLHTLHFVNQRQIMLHVSPDRIRYCPSSNVFFLELFYASRLNAPDLPPTWTTAFQEEKWAPLPAGLSVSQQQYAYLLLSWCIIKYPQFRAHWGTDKLVPEVRTHMNKLGPKNVESVLLHAALDGKDSIEFLINGCVLENVYDTMQELDRLHRWTLDLVAMHAKGQWACCTPELLKNRLERTHAMTMNAEGVVAPEIVKASKGMISPGEPWTTAKDVKAFLKSIILLPQFLQTGVFDPVNLPFHAPTDLPMLLLNYEKPSSRQSREKHVTAEDCLEAVTETLWFLENATLLYAFCRRKDLSAFLNRSHHPERLSLTRMKLGEKIEVDIHLKLLYIEANTFDHTHWSE
jgi:hypothetical protein